MESQKQLEREIKKLQEEAKQFRTKAIANDWKAKKIKDNLSKICKHLDTKIETHSYEEPGRVKYYEWTEKICKTCGKVVATLKEETTSKWIKHE